MTCCKRIYDCGNRPLAYSPSHRYHVEPAPALSRCARLTHGFAWLISRPVVFAHACYNAVQLARKKELSAPIREAVDPDRPVTPFPFPNMMLYIVSRGMEAFLKAPRYDTEDPKGLFVDRANHEVWIPIVTDIVKACDAGSSLREVRSSDFLLTAPPREAEGYRALIIDFMGPKNLSRIRVALAEVSDWVLSQLPESGYIADAETLCGTFTAGVISHVFLNESASMETYAEIYRAIKLLDSFAMRRRWGKMSAAAVAEYQKAIRTIAQAITKAQKNAVPGSFVEAMQSRDFSDTQIKAMLLLVYLAGSGTTTTALNYLLWQLGQHPEYQEKIHTSPPATQVELVSKAIAEALRLAPPVGIMGRFAARDLQFTVTDRDRVVYRYTIPKGSCVLLSPLVAAKSPLFPHAADFIPERFEDTPPALSWLPFSTGFHGCPGKSLALAELSTFVLALLKQGEIASYPIRRDLEGHLFLTLRHVTPVFLQLSKRP